MALPVDEQAQVEEQSLENLRQEVEDELDQSQRELKEIALMLEQSEVEVDKLAQRNATITSHLQQVQSQFEQMPRADIRVAYDAALESQQRMVMMRGQVEKLQGDKQHLERYVEVIRKALQSSDDEGGGGSSNGAGSFAVAEMMIQAQEAERQRLSRQMHDGPAQALSNFILQTEIAMRLFEVDQEKAREELSNLKSAASTTFQKVRDFIFDLRPMMLDDLGLAPTIKRYVDAFREKSGLDINATVSGQDKRLENYLEVLVFRSVQELINNSAQHSQATQIKVQIDITNADVRVSVEDNGRGFESSAVTEGKGLGIKLIKERVEMLGGNFELDSALGQGAKVSFSVPAIS